MKLYEAKESYFELYKLENHITNEKLAVQQLRKFIAYLDEVGLKDRIVKCVGQIDAGQPAVRELERIGGEKIENRPQFDLIKADVYKAMLSRSNAAAARTRIQSDNSTFSEMSRGLGLKAIQEQFEKICYNFMLMCANRLILNYDRGKWIMDAKLAEYLKSENLIPAGEKYRQNGIDCIQRLYAKYAYFFDYGFVRGEIGMERTYFVVATDSDKKLEQIINTVPYDADENQLITAINRCIDAVHYRGPLAGAFVEGGAETCRSASNMRQDEIHESRDILLITKMFKRLF